ncbi:DVU0298 family protein [Desulfocurvus vexinensis]|uniref:DVU0298 family protein n=1 Tax=Desulfocurvus vexinensis TaxID=399548 RepID=UPI0004AF1E14|nr:DVU0298 family protein [Desulfocurvus vexinensis]
MARFRGMKAQLRSLLAGADQEEILARLAQLPAPELVGPLFSLLLAPGELVRWRAATALGATVARMAEETPEAARVVMRRFLWHMNEESGNIGWGVAEAMGEAMARSALLAREYHKNLASYVQCPECAIGDDNFLEHPPLRLGVYWALGRLGEARPELLAHVAPDLLRALGQEQGAQARGLVARALGLGRVAGARAALEALARAGDPVDIYRGGTLERTTLGALAREALQAVQQGHKERA